MASKIFTFCTALVYSAMGLCAFIPPCNGVGYPNDVADLKIKLHFSELFWQFPMNYLLAGILIGFGVSGLLTFAKARSARRWCQALFVSALILMAIGFCPHPISDVFGFLPLYGWTTAFFLITVLATPYFAFFDGPMPDTATQAVFRQS